MFVEDLSAVGGKASIKESGWVYVGRTSDLTDLL
jgi:hypothetical protein